MPEQRDDVIDRVRAVRRRISESVDHDPEALVRHYQELEAEHQGRMLRDPNHKTETTKT